MSPFSLSFWGGLDAYILHYNKLTSYCLPPFAKFRIILCFFWFSFVLCFFWFSFVLLLLSYSIHDYVYHHKVKPKKRIIVQHYSNFESFSVSFGFRLFCCYYCRRVAMRRMGLFVFLLFASTCI